MQDQSKELMDFEPIIVKRMLCRFGIHLMYLTYSSLELEYLFLLHAENHYVEIKVNPNNLGHILIADPTMIGRWITVPCRDLDYAEGLSLEEHRLIIDQLITKSLIFDHESFVKCVKELKGILRKKPGENSAQKI